MCVFQSCLSKMTEEKKQKKIELPWRYKQTMLSCPSYNTVKLTKLCLTSLMGRYAEGDACFCLEDNIGTQT